MAKSDGRLSVDYDGRIVDYDLLELEELTLADAAPFTSPRDRNSRPW